MNMLRPDQFHQAGLPMRAAEATLFHPAPGRLSNCVSVEDFIDCYRAGLNLSRELLAPRYVVCPDAGRQAEVAVIRQTNRLVICLEGHDWQHRPKGLFAHDIHLMSD